MNIVFGMCTNNLALLPGIHITNSFLAEDPVDDGWWLRLEFLQFYGAVQLTRRQR